MSGSNRRSAKTLRKEKVLKKPYLYIDVVLNKAQKHTISVYEGDEPETLAEEFACLHGLGAQAQKQLVTLIAEQMK